MKMETYYHEVINRNVILGIYIQLYDRGEMAFSD